MPRTDADMPAISAGRCQEESSGFGQATDPRKNTLTIETR